ncbi:MAG: DUF4976 domain-containing protein, partial [Clostridia bacterium]|nr:DUF4976 domain-containing protein [Clostridia bacterium]
KSFIKAIMGEKSENGEVVVFDEYGPVRMIRTKEIKYVHRYPYGPNELYDLQNDPGEENNLIDDEKWAETVIEMRSRLQSWFSTYARSEIDGLYENVTGSGQMCMAGVYADRKEVYPPVGT